MGELVQAVLDGFDSVAVCAWCLAEREEAAQPGDSHGICRRHADEILAPVRARRASS